MNCTSYHKIATLKILTKTFKEKTFFVGNLLQIIHRCFLETDNARYLIKDYIQMIKKNIKQNKILLSKTYVYK